MQEKKTSGLTGISRRRFLKYSGIAVGAAALGAFKIKADSEADYAHLPYQYWSRREKGSMTDGEYMVLCATLAANPHNTQPWKFRIEPYHIDVFADRSRNLGSADAQMRMMLMGIGCAVENLRLAAERLGYLTQVDLKANRGFAADGLCATIGLKRTGSPTRDPWFEAIFTRQTTRSGFEASGTVPESFSRNLAPHADALGLKLDWHREPSMINGISALHKQAVRSWFQGPDRHLDGIKWWRYTREELEAKRDGISIFTSAAPFFIKQGMSWIVKPETFAGDFGMKGEIDWVDQIAPATPTWGMISTDRTDPESRLQAGRLVERIYLAAADQGYCICPMAYVTELDSEAEAMRQKAGLPAGMLPLFLFRAGKAPLLEKSVRRDLDNVLV